MASATDPLRVAGSALSTLIAQATAAAADHERALMATSEVAIGWQQRALSAEAQVRDLVAQKGALQIDLAAAQNEAKAAVSRVFELESRLAATEHAAATKSVREREMEARALELEASLAARNNELRAAQEAHAVVHGQKLGLEHDLSRATARAQVRLTSYVSTLTPFTSALDPRALPQPCPCACTVRFRQLCLRAVAGSSQVRVGLSTCLDACQDHKQTPTPTPILTPTSDTQFPPVAHSQVRAGAHAAARGRS